MISNLKLALLEYRDNFTNFWAEVFQETSKLDSRVARKSGRETAGELAKRS
jgi:hypothetical protein